MNRLLLFYRLILRPLLQEPVRAALTILAITLGVAVVLAIDLAGDAATGSFRSSMETLSGDSDLEIIATGGVPESLVGTLSSLPYAIRVVPRVEDVATVVGTGQTLPLIGLDLIAAGNLRDSTQSHMLPLATGAAASEKMVHSSLQPDSIWVGESLGKNPGDSLVLVINAQVRAFKIRGVYPDAHGNESAIVMDIAAAQRALNRFGRVDRIELKVPATPDLAEWRRRIESAAPDGVEVRPQGTGTAENRKMLAAFRWNLTLLSYIALIVGAFLIYNTISVSVVRRRPETGIVRALGASRKSVLAAFIGEAAFFGTAGALLGLPTGRVVASSAVSLMSATVETLYVSSRPGPIRLSTHSVLLALVIGVGVSLISAYSPAREASRISPVEAMAPGRREYDTRVHRLRDLWMALALAASATALAFARPIAGKPLLGYVSAILLVAASALATPAVTAAWLSVSARALGSTLGVEALLASESLAASLRRTSVLVGALSTAIAMMVSVGIMVGSFRETVRSWMNDRLPADLYLRPAGPPAPDRHPTIPPELAEKISKLPGVAGVDRLRAYEIDYDGWPATLASVDLSAFGANRPSNYLSGRPTDKALEEIRSRDAVLVSEPFTYKHHLKAGDTITLRLGATRRSFRIADVYYDYGSEAGTILMDRQTMLRYLPDRAPSNLAIYLDPQASIETIRSEVTKAAAGHQVLISSNRELRTEAVRIFDRTFAITYALEAVAIIVAVIGIAGALVALVIDRRRELGLLRFLGASVGQIRKQILVEAGLLGLLSNFVGLALGFALSLVLVYVINKQSFGWTIRFHWPVAVLSGAMTVVYLATVLAGLYPARIAVTLNPLEAVHEE